jgi:hypothetical protein
VIRPSSLTRAQKRHLIQHFRIDVEDPVRFRRQDRFVALFIWIGPALALGLLWDGSPGSAAYHDKPFEILAWSVAGFFALGNIALWIALAIGTRPASCDKGYWWYILFRSQIRPRAPVLLRWIARISSVCVIGIAAATDRSMLALVWIAALAIDFAKDRWEDKAVRSELEQIAAFPPT